MRKVLLLLTLLLTWPQAYAVDPFHFLPFENSITSEVLSPNTADTNIGEYTWDAAEKTDGAVSLRLQFKTASGWAYVLNINTLNGGNYFPTDLSSFDYINVDIYGDNSGKNIYFKFFDAASNSAYRIIDINFTGWKTFQFARAGFTQENGSAATMWTGLIGLTLASPSGGPMDIRFDNLVATDVVLNNAVVRDAANRTITVDGNTADWDLTASPARTIDNSARGRAMQASLRYAWDADYLYVLVQEAGSAATQQEPANAAAYAAGPWGFDGVSLWMDLTNSNAGQYGFNPWLGFSSSAQSGLWIARINNNDAVLTASPLANGSVATSGTFAAHNRVIEARFKWSDLASTVDAGRQPGGNLLGAIAADLRIGSDPLLIENDWNGQSFVGGSQYTVPGGADTNSSDVRLSSVVPVEISAFELD